MKTEKWHFTGLAWVSLLWVNYKQGEVCLLLNRPLGYALCSELYHHTLDLSTPTWVLSSMPGSQEAEMGLGNVSICKVQEDLSSHPCHPRKSIEATWSSSPQETEKRDRSPGSYTSLNWWALGLVRDSALIKRRSLRKIFDINFGLHVSTHTYVCAHMHMHIATYCKGSEMLNYLTMAANAQWVWEFIPLSETKDMLFLNLLYVVITTQAVIQEKSKLPLLRAALVGP